MPGAHALLHAQCWSHCRRTFIEAQEHEPEAVAEALKLIGVLYTQERVLRKKKLTGPAKLAHRRAHSLPAVEAFFAWCQQQRQRPDLLPRNPLASALHYAVHREAGLRVFLDDPEVSIDTNHLERSLRVIPTGRPQLAVRVDGARRPTHRHHPEPARDLPTPRRGPLPLPRRCPATHRRAPGQARHRTHPAGVEDDVRRPPLALRPRPQSRAAPAIALPASNAADCPLTISRRSWSLRA